MEYQDQISRLGEPQTIGSRKVLTTRRLAAAVSNRCLHIHYLPYIWLSAKQNGLCGGSFFLALIAGGGRIVFMSGNDRNGGTLGPIFAVFILNGWLKTGCQGP